MREIKNINKSWYFSDKATNAPASIPADWCALDLPHTWNGTDGQDGGNDYYRGRCCYVKNLTSEDLEKYGITIKEEQITDLDNVVITTAKSLNL